MRLRYWVRNCLQNLALVLGASLFYAALMLLQMDDGLQAMRNLLPLYILLFGGVMLAAMNIAAYKFNLPLALAFGSTRREAMAGLNLQRLLPAVVLILLAAIFSDADASLPAAQLLPAGLGWFLFLSALGSAAGMIYQRFGKVIAVVTTMLLILAGMATGMLVSMLSANAIWRPWHALAANANLLAWAALAVGLAAYAAILIPEKRTVWSCNVKL